MSLCPYCKSCLDKVIWDGDIGYDSYLCGTRVTRFDPVRSEACKAAELDLLRAVNAELLEAMRGLMKGYERRLGDWENANFNSEWNVAVSAIAKAEGKTE